MTRNEIREVLMQMMYEMDAAKTLDLETARKLAGEKLPGKNLKRSLQILSGIIEHLDEGDIPRAKAFVDGVLKKVGV